MTCPSCGGNGWICERCRRSENDCRCGDEMGETFPGQARCPRDCEAAREFEPDDASGATDPPKTT